MIIVTQKNRITFFRLKLLTCTSLFFKRDVHSESPEDFYEIAIFMQGDDYGDTLARYTSRKQAVDAYNALVSALIENEPYFKMPKK